jgi:hypothetical protein
MNAESLRSVSILWARPGKRCPTGRVRVLCAVSPESAAAVRLATRNAASTASRSVACCGAELLMYLRLTDRLLCPHHSWIGRPALESADAKGGGGHGGG